MKLGRADQLAEAFGEVAFAWSRGGADDGPLSYQQVEITPGLLDFEVTRIRPVPPIASIYFSEAIGHLRSVIDNVLFGLVESEQPDLTAAQAKSVAMPIFTGREKFDAKVAKLQKDGLTSFGPGATIGKRIASLQPFNDKAAAVPAISRAFAQLAGKPANLGEEHPLLLLQAYSNEDKHRTIRMAAAGAMCMAEDEWPPRDVAMNPVKEGDVLGQTVKGRPRVVSVSAAVLVQRPTSEFWIAPGPELDRLTAYVGEIVIPTLVAGIAVRGAFPGEMELGDNGQTLAERLAAGGPERALARSAARTRSAVLAAMVAAPRFAPIAGSSDPPNV